MFVEVIWSVEPDCITSNFLKAVFHNTLISIKESIINNQFSLINIKKSFSITLIKGALSGLRQYLANESPLKLMKNAFYFTLKPFFVLKIFKFLS